MPSADPPGLLLRQASFYLFALALAAGSSSAAPFRDATAESGIPQLNHGEGVVLRDLTGDGLPELYLPNVRGPDSLLTNLGGGKFRDSTGEMRVTGQETIGAVLADLNGDGSPDLYLVRGAFPKGSNMLLMAEKGGFSANLGSEAGLSPPVNGISAAPADYDGDGDIDLFVANWGGDRLYRNDSLAGSLKFTDVAGEYGLTADARSWGAVWGDFDGDGALDLFAARGDVGGKGGSALYFNRRGKFEKAGGKAFDRFWPMGAVAGDFDGDGSPDLFAADWDGPARLYLNDGHGGLTDHTAGSGIDVKRAVGVTAGDLDGDMLLDLAVAGYRGELKVYKNLGGGSFRDVTNVWGFGGGKKNEGVVIGDMDGDGLNDLYVASLTGGRLYLNEAKGQKSLLIRPVGQDARVFGSVVRVYGKEGILAARRELGPAHGFCAQGPLEVALPVDGETVYSIVVTFSDGVKSLAVTAKSGVVEVPWPGANQEVRFGTKEK